MKKIILFIYMFLLVSASSVFAQKEMIIEGVHQGKILYVNNPLLNEEEQEFCINQVFVNDKRYEIALNSSFFNIDFEYAGIDLGDEYKVVFEHSNKCRPSILNPEILENIYSFIVVSSELKDNVLTFTTRNETFKAPFVVEEYRWGSWTKLGAIEGQGGPGEKTYSFEVVPCKGENLYRIYQLDGGDENNATKIYSDNMVFNIEKNTIGVTCKTKKVKDVITFSEMTNFLIINSFGEEVLKGSGGIADVSNLEKGTYYLHYDNDELLTFKKK